MCGRLGYWSTMLPCLKTTNQILVILYSRILTFSWWSKGIWWSMSKGKSVGMGLLESKSELLTIFFSIIYTISISLQSLFNFLNFDYLLYNVLTCTQFFVSLNCFMWYGVDDLEHQTKWVLFSGKVCELSSEWPRLHFFFTERKKLNFILLVTFLLVFIDVDLWYGHFVWLIIHTKILF